MSSIDVNESRFHRHDSREKLITTKQMETDLESNAIVRNLKEIVIGVVLCRIGDSKNEGKMIGRWNTKEVLIKTAGQGLKLP